MGFFKSIGRILNNITGASSAASQSQKYALEQMTQSNAYQKEFAQNAHQWEVQDLIKSGLNPILSADDSGAIASGGQTGAGANNQAPISPLDFISTIATAKQMMTQSHLNEANQLKTLTENKLLPKKTAQDIALSEAQEWRAYNQALGYSESESHGGSWNETEGSTYSAAGISRRKDTGHAGSTTYTKSRTW